MELFEKRVKFGKMVPCLLLKATELGFKYTIGDVMAKSGHCKGSFHYKGLAVDLNLFDQHGTYLTKTEDHRELGEFWKSIGGTWGGDFTKPDGNHYSLGEGRRL